MTAAEAVETSVTSTNSLSQDYTNLDDHFSQTTIDTPRFKPFTLIIIHTTRNDRTTYYFGLFVPVKPSLISWNK